MSLVCPICASSKFTAQGAREAARCGKCRSLERGRLFWMIAQRINLFKPGAKVMHIAPERWLVHDTNVPKECSYWAYDFDTERYDKFPAPVAKIDLCSDLGDFPEDEFDVIVHHHVMEHLPCAIDGVLKQFRRILKPGGMMAFSMPIRQGVDTDEDLDLTMSPEDRTKRFGQHNHVRAFGTNDVQEILEAGLGGPIQTDAGKMLTKEELNKASVPPGAAVRLTAHSTIIFEK